MIFGIGADIVESARIAQSLDRFGERFARRILTDDEWLEYHVSSKPVLFLASRFAAKEALSKAMGTGLRHPVNLSYISIIHDDLGKPYFEFHPDLNRLMSDKGITQHHLSISDEINMVCAFVVLEK
ncbi:holo-ACP synthase [Nitrosomonas sp. JL21]|uniref:holo-ACP synthase n=1 Tax=Nitrosomonas sp. JL21 TaxID=153949 RepID=UPI00136B4906|nr:holo-ACP synthase [Nitrosomonas sp. JL21]MBL8497091.1 holo-ACP synthase [Nitrosomonas sp.]MCC7090672.1 holo-ACP synthase [Nitrosomonas sp.]MXS78844.1 holo-ACP synthase [Nitrosomonas sp. JL21]